MCVRAHTRGGDVSGYYEIWKPQVFDVRVSQCRLNCLVEIFSGKHRGHWISQIQQLSPPLSHFLRDTAIFIATDVR